MKTLKRITAKSLIGKLPNLTADNAAELVKAKAENREPKLVEKMDLYVIGGVANGYKVKESQYGISYGFEGDFTAVDLVTGEMSAAGVAYFPRPVDTSLKAALDAAADGAAIDVKVKVSIIPHGADRGYEYVTEVAMTGQDDRIAARRAEMLAAFGLPEIKQLAAPDDAATAAPEVSAKPEAPKGKKK